MENNFKRCVIIGAAQISDYERIKTFLSPDDFYIFCDAGLNHQEKLGVVPNLITGDFDSAENPELPVETIILPTVKDDTDTFFAVKEACKRGFTDFLLIGVIGNRFDHSLCNISILKYLYENKKNAVLLDDYSQMSIVGKDTVYIKDDCSFFSLMCIDGDVHGVNIKNAHYPLENATITTGWQYGISNQVTKGKTAEVNVKEGILLLLKIW